MLQTDNSKDGEEQQQNKSRASHPKYSEHFFFSMTKKVEGSTFLQQTLSITLAYLVVECCDDMDARHVPTNLVQMIAVYGCTVPQPRQHSGFLCVVQGNPHPLMVDVHEDSFSHPTEMRVNETVPQDGVLAISLCSGRVLGSLISGLCVCKVGGMDPVSNHAVSTVSVLDLSTPMWHV